MPLSGPLSPALARLSHMDTWCQGGCRQEEEYSQRRGTGQTGRGSLLPGQCEGQRRKDEGEAATNKLL